MGKVSLQRIHPSSPTSPIAPSVAYPIFVYLQSLAHIFVLHTPVSAQSVEHATTDACMPHRLIHMSCLMYKEWRCVSKSLLCGIANGYLRGGMVRFCAGLSPLRMHLRAWMMKCVTPPRSDTVLMKLHSASYESTLSTPAACHCIMGQIAWQRSPYPNALLYMGSLKLAIANLKYPSSC